MVVVVVMMMIIITATAFSQPESAPTPYLYTRHLYLVNLLNKEYY
jgi:hypothetical protein